MKIAVRYSKIMKEKKKVHFPAIITHTQKD